MVSPPTYFFMSTLDSYFFDVGAQHVPCINTSDVSKNIMSINYADLY